MIYHIFCGNQTPRVILCTEENLDARLEEALKDSFLVDSVQEWVGKGGVLVIAGDVVTNEELHNGGPDANGTQ